MSVDELSLPLDKRLRLGWITIFAGLSFIFLGLLDLLFVALPFKLMDARWEYLVTGRVSEHFWPVLLGVVLVLLPVGETPDPSTLGIRNCVRIGSLAFALLLLLMLPLNLVSSLRLHRNLNAEYAQWASQRTRHTDAALTRLEQLESRQDVLQFVAPLQFSPSILLMEDDTQLKDVLSEKIRGLELGSLMEAKSVVRDRQGKLWKDATKACLSILVGGVTLLALVVLARPYKDLAEFTTPEERRLGVLRALRSWASRLARRDT